MEARTLYVAEVTRDEAIDLQRGNPIRDAHYLPSGFLKLGPNPGSGPTVSLRFLQVARPEGDQPLGKGFIALLTWGLT